MRFCKMIIALSAVGLLSFPILAQDGSATGKGDQNGQPRQGDGAAARQRRAPLTAEKAKAAWELEAKSVAKELNLSGDNTTKLVSSYVEARDSQKTSLDKARRDAAEKAKQTAGGDSKPQGNPSGNPKGNPNGNPNAGGAARSRTPSESQKATAEVLKTEQDKLKTALTKFLSEDQVNKAMASLGSFDRNWDVIVNTIADFNLGEAKTAEALHPVHAYVSSIHTPRISGSGDAGRTTNRQARQDLIDAMKKVLSQEQMDKFQQAMGGAGVSRARNAGGAGATGSTGASGGGRSRGSNSGAGSATGGTGSGTGSGKGGGEGDGKTGGG